SRLAPYKVAVFPLIKKQPLIDLANAIYEEIKSDFNTKYDESGSIGKRYRRQDEIGTPYCITVDFDSLEDEKVTISDRNTAEQDRVSITKINEYLKKRI
ncbi:MAG: His/Gly/Thr/Pro-type tRNA ligase C-terminal domain-containing protein, partial [Bacillota bacterium]